MPRMVAEGHSGTGTVALLLAQEPLSSPGLSSPALTASPGTAGTKAGFVSAHPEAVPLLAASSCSVDLACSSHRAAGNQSLCCCSNL